MKRATNLSVDEDLLAEARELGVNLSQTLEETLRRIITERRANEWQQENAEAIESSNAYVDRYGLPLATFRQF